MKDWLSPNELLEIGICYCGGKIVQVSEKEWRCEKCGLGIVEK